jgi:hypothetical protein
MFPHFFNRVPGPVHPVQPFDATRKRCILAPRGSLSARGSPAERIGLPVLCEDRSKTHLPASKTKKRDEEVTK